MRWMVFARSGMTTLCSEAKGSDGVPSDGVLYGPFSDAQCTHVPTVDGSSESLGGLSTVCWAQESELAGTASRCFGMARTVGLKCQAKTAIRSFCRLQSAGTWLPSW